MNDHHGHRPGSPGGQDHATLATLLDLDGEVLHGYLSDLTAWVQRHADGQPCHRIVDLGAGTGTATFALAERFAGAEVFAVDESADMLALVRAKALDRGLADRIRTVRADLDVTRPAIEAVDLAWAANFIHHLADPDRLLRDVFGAVRSGGMLVVAEMDALPRFLPDDLGVGRPGLEERCHDALDRARADATPQLGLDWGPHLERAGFGIVDKRTWVIDLPPPSSDVIGRYAWAYLRRVRPALDGLLASDDLSVLDALIDTTGPASLLQRADLTVRGTRTSWIARRP